MAKPKPYVKCQITNKHKGILLLRRAESDSLAGVWESVGGGIEHGESPLEAVVREVQEEAGLLLSPTFQHELIFKDDHTGKPYKAHLFTAEVDVEDIDLSENPDHEDFFWLNNGNIEEFLKSGNKIDSWTMTHTLMSSLHR